MERTVWSDKGERKSLLSKTLKLKGCTTATVKYVKLI